MSKYPCRNCEERHFACWDRCEEYQRIKAIRATQMKVDEVDLYEKSKGRYYRADYGWRR